MEPASMSSSASPVPNPMAGIPLSPQQQVEAGGDLLAAEESLGKRKDCRYAAHKSSNSLASSHPSHASFASSATAESGTLSPDSLLNSECQPSAAAASSQQPHFSPDHLHSRRIKRLERNRESARLSRKRRKAYLEELEQKVTGMGAALDRQRVEYALGFLAEVGRRYSHSHAAAKSNGAPVRSGIRHNLHEHLPAEPAVMQTRTRIPPALRAIYAFQHAHLKSLVVSHPSKFVLWLMLQKEGFWRGGRANSERLSAARIGERLLNNGTYRTGPSGGMWPLFCHEIGLSYEQEDRVRNTQRAILADTRTWISRHTAVSTDSVLHAVNTALTRMHETAKKRERAILQHLTPEQQGKFIDWALSKSSAIQSAARSKLEQEVVDNEYKITPERHVAANMYVVHHLLTKINSTMAPAPTLAHPSRLKKLSRRPCFESLAGQDAPENTKSNKLSREASFPSTGSLKRTLNEMNGDADCHALHSHAHSNITVEAAHAAAQPAVRAIFQDIMPIIPQSYQSQMHLQHFRPVDPNNTNQTIPASSQTTAPEELYAKSRVTSTIMNHSPHYAPPQSSDDIDIEPTPLSALLCTNDEFLEVPTSGVPIEVTSSLTQGYIPSIEYVAPEPVSSGLTSRSYQSAPQLYTGNFDNIGMMPTVPEEGLGKSNVEEDGFDLAGLDDPHDWAIGESFDMDLDYRK